MPKKKITISEAVKKAEVSAIKDRKGSYRVDLGEDHNYTVDVEAKDIAEARKVATESINLMNNAFLPQTLKKDS